MLGYSSWDHKESDTTERLSMHESPSRNESGQFSLVLTAIKLSVDDCTFPGTGHLASLPIHFEHFFTNAGYVFSVRCLFSITAVSKFFSGWWLWDQVSWISFEICWDSPAVNYR